MPQTSGETLTIMCIGESGVGKTTLLSNIFARHMGNKRRTSSSGEIEEPTRAITESVHSFKIDGLPFVVHLIDTPGYGESANLETAFRRVRRYLDRRFDRALRAELLPDRSATTRPERAHERTGGIDAVLYFFAPHRCKGADIEYLRTVQDHAPIIPILAKADTMTAEELRAFRTGVSKKLAQAKVRTFSEPFAIISSPLEVSAARRIAPAAASNATAAADATNATAADAGAANATVAKEPAVGSANETDARASYTSSTTRMRSSAGAEMSYRTIRRTAREGGASSGPVRVRYVPSRGRVYHWGAAEPENPLHSDLAKLRRFLLFEKLADLHHEKVLCYERFRHRRLSWKRRSVQLMAPAVLLASAVVANVVHVDVQQQLEHLEHFVPLLAPLLRFGRVAARALSIAYRTLAAPAEGEQPPPSPSTADATAPPPADRNAALHRRRSAADPGGRAGDAAPPAERERDWDRGAGRGAQGRGHYDATDRRPRDFPERRREPDWDRRPREGAGGRWDADGERRRAVPTSPRFGGADHGEDGAAADPHDPPTAYDPPSGGDFASEEVVSRRPSLRAGGGHGGAAQRDVALPPGARRAPSEREGRPPPA